MNRKLTGKEKKIVLILLVLLVVAAAVYGYIRYKSAQNESADPTGAAESSLLVVDAESETETLRWDPLATTETEEALPWEEESTLPPQTDPPDLYGPTKTDQTDPPDLFGPDPTPAATLPPQTDPPETTPAQTQSSGIYVTKDGTYTDKDHVALYLHTYGKLPSNFITKKVAQNQYGWSSGKNLNSYAPGKSIGGDYFSNYEGVPGKNPFHECDINYRSGKRGAERIVWSSDGRIFYSPDHYTTYYEWFGPNDWRYAYTYND